MTLRITMGLVMCLVVALPSTAMPPHFEILIESGSPYFVPATATVTPGTPIRWDNPTATHHTVTHDWCVMDGPCAFDSGTVIPGGTYTVQSLSPGRYTYHCRLHPIMRGTLVVTESAGPAKT